MQEKIVLLQLLYTNVAFLIQHGNEVAAVLYVEHNSMGHRVKILVTKRGKEVKKMMYVAT